MNVLWRALLAFGLGVWEFLVGDTPEFLPATAALVALAFVLHGVRLVAVVGLPAGVVVVLVASLGSWRIRSRARD